MWFISYTSLCYLAALAPLEIKLWLLQAFFGPKPGMMICWLVYQASLERGSLRAITYDNAYDKGFWTCAMDYIVNVPLGVIFSTSNGVYLTNYLGRTLAGMVNHVSRSSATVMIRCGLIEQKRPQLMLM